MGKDKFIPHLLGHEGSGKVIDVGKNVKHVKKNDLVVLHWMKNINGEQSGTPKFYYNNSNKKINAGWITTFSEFSVLSSNRVTKIPRNTNKKIAALMGCCLTTGIGTILNQSKVKKENKVLVVGAGGVGLSLIIGLKISNIKNVTVADISNSNLLKAKKFGIKKILNTKNSFNEIDNYDSVFIATGNKKAIEFAIKITKAPVDIFFIGVPSPNITIKIDALDLHRKKNLVGSSGGEIKPHKDINKYLKFYNKNKSLFNKIILSTVSLEKAKSTILAMASGKNNEGRNLIRLS
jgi:Zn-dependent alcohol dehydrogenase